ncbi:APC family permease [Salinicola sp. JS01]|uniref:APC family permease n=1 Tax=Salinicola sp. JS01 TaxID=3050071 RepID=UPI00255BA8B5|nr:APC family permease [Salinicola sp. JS01]WIX32663.1 APC family permease [Salinicola sp. JS01]
MTKNAAATTGDSSQMRATLKWTEAFALSMAVSGSIFASFGYALGLLGPVWALIVWAGSAAIGACQNWIFLEVTAMFPDKPGGIAMIAVEGWRRRNRFVGPLAAFGYWMGWSSVLSIIGVSAGSLMQAQWFPNADWHFTLGILEIGIPQLIGAALIVIFWQINRRGVHLAASLSKYMGALLLIPIVILSLAPIFGDGWSIHRFLDAEQHSLSGWSAVRIILVWFFLVSWSTYGTEMCAAFGPEYRTQRDMRLSLLTSGLYTVLVFAAVAFGIGGLVDQAVAAKDPFGFYIGAFNDVLGVGYSSVFVSMLLVGLFMGLNAALADGSRALYGMAIEGITIKQLGTLNKHQVPGRCMTVAVVLNLLMIVVSASPIAILVTANLGYLLAIFFALTGFLWLRKDLPDHPRPVRLGKGWIPPGLGAQPLYRHRHHGWGYLGRHCRLRWRQGSLDGYRHLVLVPIALCLSLSGSG